MFQQLQKIQNREIILSNTVHAPSVDSGEEVYITVRSGDRYTFKAYDKSAKFVLPAKPEFGDEIYFNDAHGSVKWYPITIHRNGNLIMGEKEHMKCDVPNICFRMVFVGGYIGWKVTPDYTIFKG